MSVLEERLLEAAAIGDLDAVKAIVQTGKANVNHQHKMNGWTALHWAAKRKHSVVVAYLITSGSDENLADFSGRLPGDVTDDPEVRNLLKVSESQLPPSSRNNGLSFTPNYLRNPTIPKDDYYVPEPDCSSNRQAPNRRVSSLDRRFQDVSTSPATSVVASEPPSVVHNLPNYQEPSQSPNPNCAQRHQNPTKILKLKVEGERDFIEADLPLEEMNMNSLMTLVSSELRVNHSFIKYLRKLPDTKMRRDIDVARLNNYQEIEVVLLNN